MFLTSISIDGKISDELNPDSIFQNTSEASKFFENGDTGYSPGDEKFEGIRLKTFDWKLQPLKISHVHSSFFENESIFPKNAVRFDSALLMTEIKHEWQSVGSKSRCV